MAINPDEYERFRRQLDEIVENAPIEDAQRQYIEEEIFKPVFSEVDELIKESREPRLYVFGPAGAGKSSLINNLAEKEVAEVGSVKPTTEESQLYHIEFQADYSNWEVVDSRGLFESLAPDGSPSSDTVELMKQDLEQYKPDVLIHVITPDQLRAGKRTFEVIQNLRNEIGRDRFPPILYCLNKIDTHMPAGEGFPPDSPGVAGDIKENINYMVDVIKEWDETELEKSNFSNNSPIHGYKFDSEYHIGVLPLYLKGDPYWNFENLRWVIGDFLPTDARLQYAQANRQEELMQEITADIRLKFSKSTGMIGASPSPVVDLAVITPIQWGLIWVTAGLSCRDVSEDNVNEYMKSMGTSAILGLGARKLARSLAQVVPYGGQLVSGSAAFIITWTTGRSAELYFFDDEERTPSNLREDAEEVLQEYKSRIPGLKE